MGNVWTPWCSCFLAPKPGIISDENLWLSIYLVFTSLPEDCTEGSGTLWLKHIIWWEAVNSPGECLDASFCRFPGSMYYLYRIVGKGYIFGSSFSQEFVLCILRLCNVKSSCYFSSENCHRDIVLPSTAMLMYQIFVFQLKLILIFQKVNLITW